MKRVLQLLLVVAVATLAPLTVAAQQRTWGPQSQQAPPPANANQHHWGPAQPRTVAEHRPHKYHHRHHHHRRDHDRFRHDRDHDRH